jgi:hypothetical protein
MTLSKVKGSFFAALVQRKVTKRSGYRYTTNLQMKRFDFGTRCPSFLYRKSRTLSFQRKDPCQPLIKELCYIQLRRVTFHSTSVVATSKLRSLIYVIGRCIRPSFNYFLSCQVSQKPILITYQNFDFVAYLSNLVCEVGQNPKIEVSCQVTKIEK